jgi:GNAT superfamily N-acetyltransferase
MFYCKPGVDSELLGSTGEKPLLARPARSGALKVCGRETKCSLRNEKTMTVIRAAVDNDIPAMAAIRAREWQTEEFWKASIRAYLSGEQSPQKALPLRAAFVAVEEEQVVGFVAGHRTTRHGCDAELQWINVAEEWRGRGTAGLLIERMAAWFVEQNLTRVCVDPDEPARALYAKYGATALNRHWMVWEDSREMLRRAMELNRPA